MAFFFNTCVWQYLLIQRASFWKLTRHFRSMKSNATVVSIFQSHYDTEIFLQNAKNKLLISPPWGWYMWCLSNSLRPRRNGRHFTDNIFYYCILIKNFIEICSPGCNQQYSSIGSDNGLVPVRWQAIIWTNDGKFTDSYLHHSASMS